MAHSYNKKTLVAFAFSVFKYKAIRANVWPWCKSLGMEIQPVTRCKNHFASVYAPALALEHKLLSGSKWECHDKYVAGQKSRDCTDCVGVHCYYSAFLGREERWEGNLHVFQ